VIDSTAKGALVGVVRTAVAEGTAVFVEVKVVRPPAASLVLSAVRALHLDISSAPP
jgi:hypothetical protein